MTHPPSVNLNTNQNHIMETSVIPAHGAASLDTASSLRALAAVYQPYATPGEMDDGQVITRLKNGAPADSVLVMSPGALKFLVADVQAVIDAADGLTGAAETQLVLANAGNTTHEVTITGTALATLFDADSAAAFAERVITTRKPKVSLETLHQELAIAAKAANVHILTLVNREEATFRILKDSQANIATAYAVLVAAKGSVGCFATIDGTAPSASSAATVYLT